MDAREEGVRVPALVAWTRRRAASRGLRALQRQVALQHEVGGAVLRFGHRLRDLADAPAWRDLDIADIGMHEFKRQLLYKAKMHGAIHVRGEQMPQLDVGSTIAIEA